MVLWIRGGNRVIQDEELFDQGPSLCQPHLLSPPPPFRGTVVGLWASFLPLRDLRESEEHIL